MQIQVEELTRKKVMVEVEFPIYRRHDMDGDGWSTSLFTRVNADLSWVEVEVKSNEIEIEVGKNYQFGGGTSDYALGRGEYRCTAEEFEEALQDAEVLFARALELGRRT